MISAFGIEHGYDEVSKDFTRNKDEYRAGRALSTAVFTPAHGLVAGKGADGKIKATAAELGGAYAGAKAGGAIGRYRLLTTATGAVGGGYVAHRRGWYQRDPHDREGKNR